jgi:hypothetical protein
LEGKREFKRPVEPEEVVKGHVPVVHVGWVRHMLMLVHGCGPRREQVEANQPKVNNADTCRAQCEQRVEQNGWHRCDAFASLLEERHHKRNSFSHEQQQNEKDAAQDAPANCEAKEQIDI